MTDYRVTWSIDITADSPVEAARLALAIQRDPRSTATVFNVQGDGDSRGLTINLADEDSGGA